MSMLRSRCGMGRWWGVGVGCTLALAGLARGAEEGFGGIGRAMQEFVDKGEVMGVVTLVADKEKVLHLNAVGTSDGKRKMEKDDLFWIASMSKPITAVGAAVLVDEGKLKWDDPIEKYLPEFKGPKLAAAAGGGVPRRLVTLRDVLTHTSGWAYGYPKTEGHWTLEQFVKEFAPQPMIFEPGTTWEYSNAGIDVVGRLVEVVGGMPLDMFMQKRVFEPLGMKDTCFWITPEKSARYANTYVMDAETKKLKETGIPWFYGTEVGDVKRPPLGGAGIFSTAEDLARFYQMTMKKGVAGGKAFLKAETVAEMTRNQIGGLSAGGGLAWGLGFGVVVDVKGMEADEMLSAGSYGHVGAFGTNAWVDPKKEVVYVILFERDGLENIYNSPMRIEFQKLAATALDKR